MALSLPPLPYELDALEPAISAETLKQHYGVHHRGYVAAANRLLAGRGGDSEPLSTILQDADGPLANAAAQAWNHAFYWRCLSPRPAAAGGELLQALSQAFGSLAGFEKQFKAAAMGLFGSGWVWLVRTDPGELDLVGTPNAGLRVHEERLHPLLVCDVWEHAYYLDYQADRSAYVDAFWKQIDWGFVASRLASAGPARTAARSAGAGAGSAGHDGVGPGLAGAGSWLP